LENFLRELEKLNPWWDRGFVAADIYPRPWYTDKLLSHPHNLIDVLIGARRVGKTFILKDCIYNLLKTQRPESILYITAELPVLAKVNLAEVIAWFRQKQHPHKKIFVFVDEIQELADWQTVLKYYVDTDTIKFFVTGSSSFVLNQQTAKLTGRYLTTTVFPLNYTEFLAFKSRSSGQAWTAGPETCMQYLETGGYPNYVLTGHAQLLIETVESILYRDLLSLYGIRNPALLKTILQFLCDKITTPLSSTTIAKDLKIDPQTAASYLKYLQAVYLVYPLYRKGRSHRIVKGSTPKFYINDVGVLKLFSQTSRIGHLAENAVFLHLLQVSSLQSAEVYYDIEEDREIDFVMRQFKYDVKYRSIENPSQEITYLVPAVSSEVAARQKPLWRFLSEI
jgi:predicted AAA+ superfamily ATPase